MAKYWIEQSPWQRFPKVLVMHEKGTGRVRRYVPEDDFMKLVAPHGPAKENPISFKSVKL